MACGLFDCVGIFYALFGFFGAFGLLFLAGLDGGC